ncbi:uncharacterized protein si:dkey-92i15.4 [Brachionichthys hirsutus]|uniref:uncharacterized protein si:dkey-92i15.4 n=1 Tax=Brachionichthys hirsutus TaxID=412623 RepID=UPI003604AA05
MDFSLLPTPSEHNQQRTEVYFTVQSTNSSPNGLARRRGFRKPNNYLEEKQQSTDKVGERERNGTHIGTNGTIDLEDHTFSGHQASGGSRSGIKGQCEDIEMSANRMSAELNQNGAEFVTDRSGSSNPSSEARGRTEWRRYNLPSRSKSLDLRSRERSPDCSGKTDIVILSSRRGRDSKEGGCFEERRTGVEGSRGTVISSVLALNSTGTSNDVQDKAPLSQSLNRVSRGQSFPSRLRCRSGPVSDSRSDSSLGSKGGQSILERIEKLYGSVGFGKDCSNSRDFSPGLSLHKVMTERSYAGGLRMEQEEKELVDNEVKNINSGNDSAEDLYRYHRVVKSTLEVPLHKGAQRSQRNVHMVEAEKLRNRPPSLLLTSRDDTSADVLDATPSPVSDEDKTPTNTPSSSPLMFTDHLDGFTSSTDNKNENASTPAQAVKTPVGESPPLPRPHAALSHNNLSDGISPEINPSHSSRKKLDLDAWVAGLNTMIRVVNSDESDCEDDDDSTQKDEDSNYDSDSGESSVTITSHMSQSDRKSFSVSLSDLCNFAGVEYEPQNDSDEWQSTGGRSVSMSSEMSAFSYVSVLPTEELDKLLEEVRGLGDNNLQDYNDVQVVVLHKEVGVGLGFSLAGGRDQKKPVTVHKVFPSGTAGQEGSIKAGDVVLSINGTSLCDHAHWEALRVLRRAKARDMGVVVLQRGEISSACKGTANANSQPLPTRLTAAGQRVCVHLVKNNRDLGFSLEGGAGSSPEDRPVTVQRIFQGGPVDKVFPGDELLEIEGVSVVGMRRLEAWTLIRELPDGPVNVVLHRPL